MAPEDYVIFKRIIIVIETRLNGMRNFISLFKHIFNMTQEFISLSLCVYSCGNYFLFFKKILIFFFIKEKGSH